MTTINDTEYNDGCRVSSTSEVHDSRALYFLFNFFIPERVVKKDFSRHDSKLKIQPDRTYNNYVSIVRIDRGSTIMISSISFQPTPNRWRLTKCTTNRVRPTAQCTAVDWPADSPTSWCRRLSLHSATSKRYGCSKTRVTHSSGKSTTPSLW